MSLPGHSIQILWSFMEFWSAEMRTFQMTTLGRTSGWWDGCGHCYLIHSTPSYRQSAAQPHQPLVKWTSALTDLLDSARLGAPNSPIFLLWHVEAQSISSSPKPYSYAFSMSKHPLDFSMTQENFEKKEGKNMEKRQSMIKSWQHDQTWSNHVSRTPSSLLHRPPRHDVSYNAVILYNILVSDLFFQPFFNPLIIAHLWSSFPIGNMVGGQADHRLVTLWTLSGTFYGTESQTTW